MRTAPTLLRMVPDGYAVTIERAGQLRHLAYLSRERALKAAHGVSLADPTAWASVTTVPGGWLAIDGDRLVFLSAR